MILLVSVRWMILASLSYVAVAIDWRFHSVFDDRNWNEPIHVHVDEGVGCVNIAETSVCETSKRDLVSITPATYDTDMQTVGITVNIDFDFDPTIRTEKSHPNYRQQFELSGINHDALFVFASNKYCLCSEKDRNVKICFDPKQIYRGGNDITNPYLGYQGTNPPRHGLLTSNADPGDSASLYQTFNGIEVASNPGGESTNMLNPETQSPGGGADGLTMSIPNGMSPISDVENQPQSNLNGNPSISNIGAQTPSNIQQLASSDVGLLLASNNNELVSNEYYDILGNDEPAASNPNLAPPGAVPVPWKA